MRGKGTYHELEKANRLDRDEAIRSYKREHPDASLRRIAEVFKVSPTTVMKALKGMEGSQ